jgi:hypothetical protein
MNLHRTLVVAVLLTLIGVLPALAAEDVLAAGADSRLNQKVDFDADGARVCDILGSLALRTGVNMAAGVDDNDWMVHDRKVILHIKGMLLRDLMREIASILRFDWTSSGTGADMSYVLLQTEEQAKEEQSLRDSKRDAKAKLSRERRESILADMANLGSLGKEDAAKLANTDPWRYVLATEPLGRGLTGLFNSFPDARNAFLQGTEVSFPVSQLTPELQATVRGIAESYDSLQQRIGASEDHTDLLSRFNKLQVTINRNAAASISELLAKSLLGGISVGLGTESIYVPIFDPASGMAKALGRAIVRLQTGLSKEEVGKQLASELKSEAEVSQSPNASGQDITSDPSLRRRMTLCGAHTTALLAATLKLLAENTGLNIISDSFPSKPQPIAGGEKSLGEQLEEIRIAYGSNWEKSGSVLRFKDSEWFTKRSWEVPQVWVDYWVTRGRKNNGLLLEDLVQIARLRDAQIDNTVATEQALVGVGADEVVRNRDILRFYASLSYDQQKTMATGNLEISSITDEQWALLKKALATKGAAYAAAEKGSQSVRLSQSGADIVEYDFSYYPSADDPAVVFKVKTWGVYGVGDEMMFPAQN